MTALCCGWRKQQKKIAAGDYTLAGVQGKELHTMTAGVVGTGRIGYETISYLEGISLPGAGQRSLYENERTAQIAQYVPLEELLAQADIVFLHCPMTADNYHLLNADTIGKMKDGVRGEQRQRRTHRPCRHAGGIESGKVAGFGFDVYETKPHFCGKRM